MKEKLQKIYSSKVVQAIFIILPFVEFITSYMVLNVDFPITLGVIYKTLFLIYGLGYLIFVDKENNIFTDNEIVKLKLTWRNNKKVERLCLRWEIYTMNGVPIG